jgi:phosphopantothenate synthetase
MKIKRLTIRAYTIALLTLVLGIALSINQNDWSWFARSGSLIVVNGILLTSHHIIEHMQQLKQHQANHHKQVYRDWANEKKNSLLKESAECLWTNEKYGLYMLVLGTVVWGFGDIFNLL